VRHATVEIIVINETEHAAHSVGVLGPDDQLVDDGRPVPVQQVFERACTEEAFFSWRKLASQSDRDQAKSGRRVVFRHRCYLICGGAVGHPCRRTLHVFAEVGPE
jgi:hypothetical protein